MKKILLALFMVALLVPGYSQMTRKERKEKKHTPALSFLKNQPQQLKNEKASKGFSFIETGTLGLRNNAQADSVLVYMNNDFKYGDLILFAKEIPTYMEGSFRVKEVETWYAEDAWKEFFPAEKTIAFYDENDELLRYEVYYWFNDQWLPDFAEELIINEMGEEVHYAWFLYSESAQDWELIDGFRAIDELDENGVLSVRIWEYYNEDQWLPQIKEVYLKNDEGIIIGITESTYQNWLDEWVEFFQMVFELDENNTWESGYGFEWDYELEDWYPTMKYVDIDWYDFDQLKISQVITMMNADEWEDDEDWDNKTREDEIEWENFMRTRGNYSENGRLAMMELSIWNEEDWLPVLKTEQSYDQLDNLIYDAQSAYDAWEEEWIVMHGIKVDMEYNEDGSVKFADGYVIFDDEYKNKFMHLLRFAYYYPEDISNIPGIQRPDAMVAYPNPATSHINVVWNGNDEKIKITILGVDGRSVSRYDEYHSFSGEHIRIDISHLQNGVYMVYCQGEKHRGVARFIKKQTERR